MTETYLVPEEVVAHFRGIDGRTPITVRTLSYWRAQWMANARRGKPGGPGPRWIRLGESDHGPIRYRLSDVEAWIADHVCWVKG